MKKLIAAAILSATALIANAQEEHLKFQGVPIEGNINQFTDNMQPRYKLKKKQGGEQRYIYEGPVYGYNCYLEASYSRKSRTVYKVMVTPKSINQSAWLDSLSTHYGEPIETDRGLLWAPDGGKILFYTPEGYDPVLIYLDSQGLQRFSEEK